MVRTRNYHVGGQQLPLIKPDSDWKCPVDLPDLRGMGRIALDVENRDDGLSTGRGSGWPYHAGHIIGIAAAWSGGQIYLPTRHPEGDCIDEERVKNWTRDHCRAPGLRVVFHHASHDVGWLKTEWGIDEPALIDDTEGMAQIVDEERLTYNLDDLCKWRGIPGKDESLLREAAAAYGVDPKKEMYRIPARYVGYYGAQDAVATLDLANLLDPILDQENTREAYQLEMDLIPMVHAMRRRGIRVDMEAADKAVELLYQMRNQALRDLSSHLKQTVSMVEIGNNRWLCRVHDAARVSYPRTATGMGSFKMGKLGWMRTHPHPLPRLIARVDQLHEAAHKFVETYILGYAHRGRLHASVNQYRGEEGGTRTTRFSYSDPPLQQMPFRDEEMMTLIRGLFLPEEGETWLSADYSQQEYRLIVHFACVLGLTKAEGAAQLYRDDPTTDFHKLVSEWTGLERKPAKDTNFAKSFGAGIEKFADMIGKSRDEAEAIMKQYDDELPFVSELAQRCDSLAARRGYIRLLDGARSHYNLWELAAYGAEGRFPPCSRELALEKADGKRIKRAHTRKAMNRLIQGSAARQMKLAMRECWREKIIPLIQMHDELGLSVTEEAIVRRVAEIMRDVVTLRVPMQVDTEVGPSWGQARHGWAGRAGKGPQ